MILYNSHITEKIFENLKILGSEASITTIVWSSIVGMDLAEDILTIARNLSQYGIKKGDRVALLVKDNILFTQIIVSSMLCGGTIVLLDPAMGRQMMREKIIAAWVKYIFIEGIYYDALFLSWFWLGDLGVEYIIHGISFLWFSYENTRRLTSKNNIDFIYEFIEDTAECMLVFTGGTTGNPKWVIHTVWSLLATAKNIWWLIHDSHIFYADMPHFLLLGLLMWVKIIAGSQDISWSKFVKILEKYKVDTYFSPPYRYNYALEHSILLPKTLKNILLGSAPVHSSFLRRFELIASHVPHIICIYGMTEVLPIATIDAREKMIKVSGWDILWYTLPCIEYILLEKELLIKSDVHTASYLWEWVYNYIPTGDLVIVEDNMIILQWRKKDMIIRKEYNIYPWIYEVSIMNIPRVSEVAMVGIYDEHISDEKIILFIEMLPNSKIYSEKDILSLLSWWEHSIDSYALPDEIFFLDLPRKWRQKKIDKQELKNIYKKIQ